MLHFKLVYECMYTDTYQYFNFKYRYKIFRHCKLCLENLETSTVPTPLTTLDPRAIQTQFWSNQTDAHMAGIKQTIQWVGKECMELKPKDPHTNSPDWSPYISFKNSWENLVQEVFSLNLVIYLLFTLIDLLMLLGENWCWPLLGPKGLSLH